MTTKQISITELSLDPSNLRLHDRRNIDAIKASLRKFGQQKPIVIDGNNIVIAGNGTFKAAEELGWTEIAVIQTNLVGSAATAFAIADNRTSELAEWDQKLTNIVNSLKTEGYELNDLGFTDFELAKLFAEQIDIQQGVTDPYVEWQEMPKYEGEEPCFRKIVVNFDRAEDVQLFLKAIGQDCSDKTKSIWFPEKKNRDLKSQMWVEGPNDKFDALK